MNSSSTLPIVADSVALVALAVRASLAPLRRFRARLSARGGRDLSPVPTGDLPAEIDRGFDVVHEALPWHP